MRVIGGSARGRRLSAPRGDTTRPLTDRLKESLFSALGERVAGARVLDLFAGSGSIGLEALSRGAATAVFVETDRAALQTLRCNIDAVGLGGDVAALSVEHYVERTPGAFDLIFLDPPYALSDEDVGRIIAWAGNHLTQHGVVVVHRRRGAELVTGGAMLCSTWHRRYGDAEVWWLQKEQST